MSGPGSSVTGFVRAVLSGYRRIASGTGALVLFFVVIAAMSAVIVVPLWLLSTRLPAVFTAFTAALFGAILLLIAVLGARRRARLWGGGLRWARHRVAPVLLRIATGVGLAVLLCGALLLIAIQRYLAAGAVLVGLLLLVGLRANHGRAPPPEEGVPPADERSDGKES